MLRLFGPFLRRVSLIGVVESTSGVKTLDLVNVDDFELDFEAAEDVSDGVVDSCNYLMAEI